MRQLHFGQAPTTRQPLVSNDDTKNNPFDSTTADDQIRPLSGLGKTLTSAATLATANLGSLAMPEMSTPAPSKQSQIHPHLTRYLNTTIYDVSAFGSVPNLIDYRV